MELGRSKSWMTGPEIFTASRVMQIPAVTTSGE